MKPSIGFRSRIRSTAATRCSLLVCLATIVLCSNGVAEDGAERTKRLAAAEKALAHLSETVDIKKKNPVVLSLAGLAYLAGGSTPETGPYKAELNAIIDRLKKLGKGGPKEQSWDYSFACMFLTEVYATAPDKRLKKTIEQLVDALQENQRQDGGWSHKFQGPGSRQYFQDGQFTAATTPALIALGFARMAGFTVKQEVIVKGTDFIERSINKRQGSLGYDPRNGSTSPGRTGAGVVALLAVDQGKNKHLPLMITYMRTKAAAAKKGHGSALLNVLECAMGNFVAGDRAWADFMEALGREILESQQENGDFPAFPGDKGSGGGVFDKGAANTSGCAIILLLPERSLPLLSRLHYAPEEFPPLTPQPKKRVKKHKK